ncbi:MAG: type II toxin-antitoxin system VapC family toxin [Campylobacterales bacterium]|nr:type II toxin-antitoxin system VapC family toxin [Campylobacterales bacterium]
MIYLDTNVLLYATLSKIDTPSQQAQAVEILRELINNESLLLSNLTLLEYAFVMKKAKEDTQKIKSTLKLFQTFVKDENDGFKLYLLEMLNNDFTLKNSFDLYHVVFAKVYKCKKLITFDKGFKKLQDIADVEIEVL